MAPKLKQKSLFQLSGVVSIERIEAAKRKLSDPDLPAIEKVVVLKSLAGKKPSTKVIKDTGIGRTVRRLTKHEDPVVRKHATSVYEAWKAEVERRTELSSRGPLEVACDLDTQNFREKSIRLLGQYDKVVDAVSLEKVAFDRCGHLLNNRYRRCVRKMVFALKARRNKGEGGLKADEIQAFVSAHIES